MPQKVWAIRRAQNLARTINTFLDEGMENPDRIATAQEWIKELDHLIDTFELTKAGLTISDMGDNKQ